MYVSRQQFETSYWKYGLTHFGNIGPPTLEIWARPYFQYGLWCVVLCGFGETILEILAHPYFQYGLAHISIMGVVLVCGFCETILEILARP